MRRTQILKISQKERDDMFLEFSKEDYVDNNSLLKLRHTVAFEYVHSGVKIKGSGIVIGFKGKQYGKKVMLLNQNKDILSLPLNSSAIKYTVIKGSKLIPRRAKLYFLANKK